LACILSLAIIPPDPDSDLGSCLLQVTEVISELYCMAVVGWCKLCLLVIVLIPEHASHSVLLLSCLLQVLEVIADLYGMAVVRWYRSHTGLSGRAWLDFPPDPDHHLDAYLLQVTEVISDLYGMSVVGFYKLCLLVIAANNPVIILSCLLQVTEVISDLYGMAVVGWYHSHPSFPALPSVIDIANQLQMQQQVRPRWFDGCARLWYSLVAFSTAES
jgi:hypothetical protein